jgi:PST family polysaccharide transporter
VRDPERYLRTDHLKDDLRGRSLRGGTATLAGQACKLVLTTCSTVILARLLLPEDFGLIAMVTAITQFAMYFRDLGLSTATIQREEITHAQVSTLFWVNAGFGVLVTVLVIAAAPLIAWFYGEPRLQAVTMVIALVFLLSGLAVQHEALLRRQMRFSVLASVEVGAGVVGLAAALVGVFLGMGYWALVASRLATSLSVVIAVWCVCGWHPSRPKRGTGVRPMLFFGGNITLFNILNYFARNLDSVLIGRFFGPTILGFYDRAYRLLMMPIGNIRAPINAVSVPALSRLQNEPERYRRYYCKVVTLIAFLSMPLMAFCFAAADPLIVVLLGPRWTEVIVYAQILAVVGFIQPVVSSVGSVYVSTGRAAQMLRWGVWNSAVIVLGFVCGIPWGAKGVAIGYAVATYVLIWPTLWYVFQGTSLRIRDFLAAIWRPATASVFMVAGMQLIGPILPAPSVFVLLGFLALVGPVFYLSMWFMLPGGRDALGELASYIKQVLGRKNPSVVASVKL